MNAVESTLNSDMAFNEMLFGLAILAFALLLVIEKKKNPIVNLQPKYIKNL